jgi:hypothetical protein
MRKQRELREEEVRVLIDKIIETNPAHLWPQQREAWIGIRETILRGQRLGAVWLSEKQKSVIHKAWWRSRRTVRMLHSPTHYDANDRFDAIANPVKSF